MHANGQKEQNKATKSGLTTFDWFSQFSGSFLGPFLVTFSDVLVHVRSFFFCTRIILVPFGFLSVAYLLLKIVNQRKRAGNKRK